MIVIFISLPIKFWFHLEQLPPPPSPLGTKPNFPLHCQTSNALFVSLPSVTDSGPDIGPKDVIIIWRSTMAESFAAVLLGT